MKRKRPRVRTRREQGQNAARGKRCGLVPQEADLHAAVAQMLGGGRAFKKVPTTGFAFHDALKIGFPARTLIYVAQHAKHITGARIAELTGVRLDSTKRRSSSPSSRLTPNQSGNLWRFAKVLCRATEVLGGLEEAEQWLCSPVTALDQKTPIYLLRTSVG